MRRKRRIVIGPFGSGGMTDRPDTVPARANADRWFRFGAEYRAAAGLEPLTPVQMAYPLAFLCSDAASGVTGTCLIIDQGLVGAALTDTFDTPGTKARFGLEPDPPVR